MLFIFTWTIPNEGKHIRSSSAPLEDALAASKAKKEDKTGDKGDKVEIQTGEKRKENNTDVAMFYSIQIVHEVIMVN